MADLTRAQAQTILTRLGWRVNTSARLTAGIKDFQRGYNFGSVGLSADGVLGPKTSAAMRGPSLVASQVWLSLEMTTFSDQPFMRMIWS